MVAEGQPASKVSTKMEIPAEVPILAVSENMVLPSIMFPVATQKPNVARLIDAALAENKIIGIFAQRTQSEEPKVEDLYSIGTAASIDRMFKMPDNSIRVLLQGLARVRLSDLVQVEPYLRGRIEVLEERVERTTELEALTRNLSSLFQRVVEMAPNLPSELATAALNITEADNLADFVAAHVNLKPEERQEILEAVDVSERMKKLTEFVNREVEILELGSKIQSQIKGEMDKAQRDFYLREQLKAIQKELGETDERSVEINEIRKQLEEVGLPEEARKEATMVVLRVCWAPSTTVLFLTMDSIQDRR